MNDTDKQNHYLLMPKIVLFHNLTCETPSTGTDCCYTVILFEFEYVDLIHLLLLPLRIFILSMCETGFLVSGISDWEDSISSCHVVS